MFLVRKITRSKWTDKIGIGADEISADAITADLRTQGKSLSFWKCEIDDAILALASARDELGKIEVVWVADEELQNATDRRLEATKGKTRVRGLIDRHVDACGLDYVRLGAVARIIAGALEKQQYRRSTKAGVRKLLVAAIKDGRLKLEDLEQDVKDEIAKAQTP